MVENGGLLLFYRVGGRGGGEGVSLKNTWCKTYQEISFNKFSSPPGDTSQHVPYGKNGFPSNRMSEHRWGGDRATRSPLAHEPETPPRKPEDIFATTPCPSPPPRTRNASSQNPGIFLQLPGAPPPPPPPSFSIVVQLRGGRRC